MRAQDEQGRRLALIIADSEYQDPTLEQLRAPGRDASDLAGVLRDPAIGTFDVRTLINTPSDQLLRGVAQFCHQADPGDLVLVYLSCHGVLDDRGRLYYATIDTERALLSATAMAADWLNDQLEDCRARQQILLLDCCHSGAFAKGRKGDDALALKDRFSGRGKVVLTASRATEYSFEGATVVGEGVRSAFTRAVVDGLRTGQADRDKDGLITVEDLYRHVYATVRDGKSRQTPELWAFGAEGDLLVARSVRGPIIEPAPLPDDVRLLVENSRLVVRESGVKALAELLDEGEPGVALTARLTLQRISEEDLPRIAALARAAHDANPGQAVTQLEAQEGARREAEQKARQEAERAAARRQQQIEQLQDQIRERAAAQDWQAVVAASGELAALDPDAADPDGLASAAREQITRRQQAEEAAARQRQQVEQLQDQIRERAAAQDWQAVVAASGELAALDPDAADPDGLASAAREQITRRQQAEEAAARQRQQVEQLQDQIRERAAAQDWQAVVAASGELAALDPDAADPDGLASAAREQITRRQQDAGTKTEDQDAYSEPDELADLGRHAEREDHRDDEPATPGQLGKDLTATQAFDSALPQETSSVPADAASQIAPDTQPSGLPSEDAGDGTTEPPGSWWSRHRVLAPAGAAGAVVVLIGISLLLSSLVGARSPETGTHNASASNTTGVYGSVPPAAAGTQYAGTISVAQAPGSAPTWILPIITSADDLVWNVNLFDYLMYRPLYWLVNGVEPKENPSLSLASDPTVSNADKIFTIQLKSTYHWSDGKPITSQDVLFWFDELKAAIAESPSNWGDYAPNVGIPDQVASVTAPNPATVVFTMKSAVNPVWFWQDELGTIQPMPAHAWAKASATGPMLDFTDPANATKIYNFLAAQSRSDATWASNPLWKVVDGPYQLSSFDDGGFTMTPNKAYGGPTAKKTSSYSSMPFTTDTAEYNAVRVGSLDIGYVPIANLPQLNSIKSSQGYLAYGDPDFGFSDIVYNFKDSTGNFDKVISQLYFRQALAHLQDQPSAITAIFNDAAAQAYGPIPSIPNSPYAPPNALTNPYPFSISTAGSILNAHGWTVVPGGMDTCAKPGSGPSECGAGIPAGTRLSFNLIYSTSPAVVGEQVTAFASAAKKVGIILILSPSNFDNMITNYDDPAAPANINKWAMEDFGGFTDSTYPTTFAVFDCSGSQNIGGYCDPHADALINGSVSGPSSSAVTDEAEYLTAQQPCLFQPTPTTALGGGAVLVWKKALSGPPAAFQSITQYYINPEEMYFTSKP